MKRKLSAKQNVFGNAMSQVDLSYEDISNIVSTARIARSEAIVKNIKAFMNPCATKEPESDFFTVSRGMKSIEETG